MTLSDTHSVGLLWMMDEPSIRTTHNIHDRQTPTPLGGFDPAIPAKERQQTYVIDRTATRIAFLNTKTIKYAALYKTVSRLQWHM